VRQQKRALSVRPGPARAKFGKRLPVLIEKGCDGYHVVDLILEDANARQVPRTYSPEEFSLHTISV
jgi:hypothetical protein